MKEEKIMTYTDSYSQNVHPASLETYATATGAAFCKFTVATFDKIHRKWTNRRARSEFAGLNDHLLREIGIHRSEIIAVTEEGVGLGGARYYQ